MGITLLHEDPSAHAPRTKTMFTCRIGMVLSFYPAERNIVVLLESTTTTVWKYDKVPIFPLSLWLMTCSFHFLNTRVFANRPNPPRYGISISALQTGHFRIISVYLLQSV